MLHRKMSFQDRGLLLAKVNTVKISIKMVTISLRVRVLVEVFTTLVHGLDPETGVVRIAQKAPGQMMSLRCTRATLIEIPFPKMMTLDGNLDVTHRFVEAGHATLVDTAMRTIDKLLHMCLATHREARAMARAVWEQMIHRL